MSTLNRRQIRKFQNEFPFLDDVFDRISSNRFKLEKNVTQIVVSKADASSLYSVPVTYLAPQLAVFDGNGFIGHAYSYAYAINSLSKIVDSMVWGENCKNFFLKDVLNWCAETTEYLVRITSKQCFKYIRNYFESGLESPAGPFSHWDNLVIVYKKPDVGFANYLHNLNLSSNVPINNINQLVLQGEIYTEAKDTLHELSSLVSLFSRKVGMNLWRKITSGKNGCFSGNFGNTKVMTTDSMAKIIITLESNSGFLNFCGSDSEYTGLNLYTMNCDVDSAKRMVNDVVDNWDPNKLVNNRSISIATIGSFG